jgi:drug/metabolite transporter (DMT)-like permease
MGSSFPTGKILLAKVPPFSLAGWRFVAAAFATLPIALWASGSSQQRSWTRTSAHAVIATVCIGLTQTGGTMGFLNLTLRTLPASTAAILLFSNPIWVALVGGPLLGDHLSPTRWAGLALGVVGVALTVGLSLSWEPAGTLMGLASSLCFAAATIINKRFKPSVNSWMLTFWQMLIGGLALLAVATLFGERWPMGLTRSDWAAFWWLTIPASTGSFGLWFLALQRAGATQASGFLFLAPVFAVVLSHLLLQEAFSPLQALGALLVVAALCLVRGRRTEASRAEMDQVSK